MTKETENAIYIVTRAVAERSARLREEPASGFRVVKPESASARGMLHAKRGVRK